VTPTIIVPPTVEPVSLVEAKLWTKAEGTAEDALLTSLIVAAREVCEWKKGYAFFEQTLRVSFCGWPCGRRWIELPRSTPLRSIEDFTYTDSEGPHDVDSADYALDTVSIPGRIVFVDGYSWPTIDLYAPNPIVIDYKVGAAVSSPPDPFPESIKIAMQLLIEHWYRNREAVVVGSAAAATGVELPMGVDALLGVNQALYAF
jgi:uncharacterized phiE125 gp8 family phage protein